MLTRQGSKANSRNRIVQPQGVDTVSGREDGVFEVVAQSVALNWQGSCALAVWTFTLSPSQRVKGSSLRNSTILRNIDYIIYHVNKQVSFRLVLLVSAFSASDS